MEKIKDLILRTVPEAVFEEKKQLTVSVEPNKLHLLAETLYGNAELPFDYLVMMVGMDWGDTLGVIYLLSSSKDVSKEVVLKTATADRVNPLLYSVTDIWETAHLNEREVYGLLGIRFINNPDMRRFFLNSDWKGFPLRKDYDPDSALNPVSVESKEIVDVAPRIMETPQGLKEEKVNIFEEDDYIINIGPQHPSMHGVMHFRTALDGEIVKKIDIHSGYIHRGIEKLSESLAYPQILHFTDRLDYLSANINRHALCMCVEKAAEIEISERAQYIRVITDELNRIQSHLLAWAAMCNDLGSTTAFIYGFREREMILDIFEKTSGGRLIINYNVVGGVMFDIYDNFQKDVKAFIPVMREALKEYHRLFSGNVIALGRMRKIGMMSKEDAITYGVSGASGRASGWSCDIRKHVPYSIYDKVDFKEIIRDECDSYARYMVRLDEIEESLKIIEQLIDNIPAGEHLVKTKPIIKLPEGSYFQRVETGRGDFGVFIESRGDKTPYRIKFRSPSMVLVSAMPLICKGEKLADLIGIGGSMDYVIPDIDR
ncbi:NADH-quinone oxidoreductase subunit C/D [Dysgonomonas sp. PH5-45]|uniref:NADH-quinone oxidoreductase subunit D n=1 Tax=unclassified Dysgonomonas TaxID=2630389 RepID=UPI002474FA71|nr:MULTISPECIES: NADH-quinone oxidoreductase subunit D [unclassified Dysgonomonas]MDH6355749.1 NADH-quinone oxidoreductase subunit C/D [Dysgonomonas sp. PH5-45]MDH6388646.1 NADH-quinone oxidoreductase subunit C/D [Dysgonomonas sp. PH5-37]